MNAQDTKKLSNFPSGLDKAVNDLFGPETKCESGFNIVEMRHITNFEARGARRKQIRAFIDGFMAGNKELAERLSAK